MLRDLRRRRPDPAADRVHQHPLPGGEASPRDQGIVRGEKGLRHGGRRLIAERVGDRQCLILVHREQLGHRATADQSHHPVAHLPAGDAPNRLDLARVLHAGDVGGPARRRRVVASPLQQIGPVEARRPDANPDVTRMHLGPRHFPEGDDFGSSGAGVDHGSHARSPPHRWFLRSLPRYGPRWVRTRCGRRGVLLDQVPTESDIDRWPKKSRIPGEKHRGHLVLRRRARPRVAWALS